MYVRDYEVIVSLQECMIVSGRICSRDCAYEYVYVCSPFILFIILTRSVAF